MWQGRGIFQGDDNVLFLNHSGYEGVYFSLLSMLHLYVKLTRIFYNFK